MTVSFLERHSPIQTQRLVTVKSDGLLARFELTPPVTSAQTDSKSGESTVARCTSPPPTPPQTRL